MGNCSFKETTGECHHFIRVLTDSGTILQFKGPKTVNQVLQNHPGYCVFRQGRASIPLPEQEKLSYGLLYYLLPLKDAQVDKETSCTDELLETTWKGETVSDHERAKNSASDYVESLSNGLALEVLPSSKNGVWRVKLAIDTRQLEEILSKQVNTEALIEKMRMAATATTSCSISSPARNRNMSTWKVGWKPTFFNTLWAPVINSGKITKVDVDVGSNLE